MVVPEELFLLYSPCVGKELGPGNQDLARVMTKTHHPLPAEYHLVKDWSLAFNRIAEYPYSLIWKEFVMSSWTAQPQFKWPSMLSTTPKCAALESVEPQRHY